MGVTAHWIERKSDKMWTLTSNVIAFKSIIGTHDGENLGQYFVSLCKRAGILDAKNPKVHLLFSFSFHSSH